MTAGLARWGGGLAVAALALSIGGVAGTPPAGAVPGSVAATATVAEPAGGGVTAAGSRSPAAAARSVTLITGDRITVGANGRASVRPGPGRTGIPMRTVRRDGHLHVVPADAEPLLRSGRVDARLFDVTTLLEFGYDDRRPDLPLIVSGGPGGAARAGALARTADAEVVRDLPAVAGTAIHAAKPRLTELWQTIAAGAGSAGLRGSPVTVWLDGLRKPTLEHSVPQIGAPTAWQAGYDGTGVTVAVLDTGVDADHPDLVGQVIGRANFTGGVEDDRDLVGHGTHVASTIAGTGAASDGRRRGVAPGAKLLDGKVCVESGCAESWIVAGMQWAAEQGAAVVNLSLGGPDGPEVDPLEAAVESLTNRYGTLFVVSAGNNGEDGTISSPASADAALAVGAVDRDGNLADFSSRGPRTGDSGLKPDITAPGVEIVAARSSDAFPGESDPYVGADGTSMAAPHVAGAAAILAQRHPEWRGPTLKAALMASAVPNPELSGHAQGAGRVDVARAITQTITVDAPSLSLGRQLWPHHDDTPVTRTVTYTNHGDAPVTLDLSVTATGPAGTPAPAGMFTVSPATVTVPAGGTAEVTITADTRVSAPDGFYTGRLVGSVDGEAVVGTPFAVEREEERYDVTITHRNRAGAPTTLYSTTLVTEADADPYEVPADDATVTLRLPKGRYLLFSFVDEELPENPDPVRPEYQSTLLVRPAVDVTAPTTLTVDAREAGQVAVTVPEPDAEMFFGDVAARLNRGEWGFEYGLLGDPGSTLYAGQLGDDRPVDALVWRVAGVWAPLDAQAQPRGSLYHLAWAWSGGAFTGFTRNLGQADLATVRSRYARHLTGPDAAGSTWTIGSLPGISEGGWAPMIPTIPPLERTEYFNTDGGLRWYREFVEWFRDADGWERTAAVQTVHEARYQRGTVTREHWNQAVFAPTLADPSWPDLWITRTGDELYASVPMFGDAAGHVGGSMTESASLTLYRNGTKLGTTDRPSGAFELPAGAADYRLTATATRGAPFTLATRVATTWSFRSQHVAGDDPVRLPLATVRFSPPLDLENTAPAGRLFAIPVSVVHQPGSAAARTRSLTVEVSYDDGRTWRRAPVLAFGDTGTVLLRHPARAGFVSLRATATDRAGTSVHQTVIRAYALR